MDIELSPPIGVCVTLADWRSPKVGGHLMLYYIHQINRMNSQNDGAVMKAP